MVGIHIRGHAFAVYPMFASRLRRRRRLCVMAHGNRYKLSEFHCECARQTLLYKQNCAYVVRFNSRPEIENESDKNNTDCDGSRVLASAFSNSPA